MANEQSNKAIHIELSGFRDLDEERANEIAGLYITPKGYTWHHDMPCGAMVLVQSKPHDMFTHTGGFTRCDVVGGKKQ